MSARPEPEEVEASARSPHMPLMLGPARVLLRFTLRTLLLIGFAAFAGIGFSRGLAALLWMSIILCAAVGLIRREPLFGAALNHWDEAVAFAALFALVHAVNDLTAA